MLPNLEGKHLMDIWLAVIPGASTVAHSQSTVRPTITTGSRATHWSWDKWPALVINWPFCTLNFAFCALTLCFLNWETSGERLHIHHHLITPPQALPSPMMMQTKGRSLREPGFISLSHCLWSLWGRCVYNEEHKEAPVSRMFYAIRAHRYKVTANPFAPVVWRH